MAKLYFVRYATPMCGRYARRGDKQKIAEAFPVKDVPHFAMPDADYIIAPTTFQPIIRGVEIRGWMRSSRAGRLEVVIEPRCG
jgi:putative SOS response-associated peptidase YedK